MDAKTNGALEVDDAMVERAICAAMRECRLEGVAMSDKRWDMLFPSKRAWRAAVLAALSPESAP